MHRAALLCSVAMHVWVPAGCLTPSASPRRDLLFVGGPGSVQAHDMRDNRDCFVAEARDGVRCLTTGQLGANDTPVLVVGGGSSVSVSAGRDPGWTPPKAAQPAQPCVRCDSVVGACACTVLLCQ